MIKIECEASDLRELVEEMAQAKASLSASEQKLYAEQDKVYALRNEVDKLKANPPRPEYARMVADLVKAVSNNERISAIKAVREITGFGLKESKDLVEANMPHWAYKQNG
jgi:ribosomal protein L7/L12